MRHPLAMCAPCLVSRCVVLLLLLCVPPPPASATAPPPPPPLPPPAPPPVPSPPPAPPAPPATPAPPTATLVDRQVSCATKVCGNADGGPGNPSMYNWAGPGGFCTTTGECSDEYCCTNGGNSVFAPDYLMYDDCNSQTSLLSAVQEAMFKECEVKCDKSATCWGYFWSPGDKGVKGVGNCRLAQGPMSDCTVPMLSCPDDSCHYHAKAMLPWFGAGGPVDRDVHVGALAPCVGAQPLLGASPWMHNIWHNYTAPDCVQLCEAYHGYCDAAEWRSFDDAVWRSLDSRDRSDGDGAVLVKTECLLWGSMECPSEREQYLTPGRCHHNGTCYYRRTANSWYCDVSMSEYWLHTGPMACICTIGFLCLTSCGLMCWGMRKGHEPSDKAHAKWCCGIFAVFAVPCVILWSFGFVDTLRNALLKTCPGRVEPPWGMNLDMPVQPPNVTGPASGHGTVNVHYMHMPALPHTGMAAGTLHDTNMSHNDTSECLTQGMVDGHFWERGSECLAPAAWGDRNYHLPHLGSPVWGAAFDTNMPTMGQYDFQIRCATMTPDSFGARQGRVMSDTVASGNVTKVVQLLQYQSKDGSCSNISWEVMMAERDCLATTTNFTLKDGTQAALILTATCWSCEWLRWEGVKNAPYQMLMVNSVCSLFFGSIFGLVFTVLFMLGDIIAKFVPPFKKHCSCLTNENDDDDEGQQFCPCAPDEERRRIMLGDFDEWTSRQQEVYERTHTLKAGVHVIFTQDCECPSNNEWYEQNPQEGYSGTIQIPTEKEKEKDKFVLAYVKLDHGEHKRVRITEKQVEGNSGRLSCLEADPPLRRKKPMCSGREHKLTCVYLGMPGFCDIFEDWRDGFNIRKGEPGNKIPDSEEYPDEEDNPAGGQDFDKSTMCDTGQPRSVSKSTVPPAAPAPSLGSPSVDRSGENVSAAPPQMGHHWSHPHTEASIGASSPSVRPGGLRRRSGNAATQDATSATEQTQPEWDTTTAESGSTVTVECEWSPEPHSGQEPRSKWNLTEPVDGHDGGMERAGTSQARHDGWGEDDEWGGSSPGYRHGAEGDATPYATDTERDVHSNEHNSQVTPRKRSGSVAHDCSKSQSWQEYLEKMGEPVSMCRYRKFMVNWYRNFHRWLNENWDSIMEYIQAECLKYDDAKEFAASRAAPTFSYSVFKSIYMFVFFYYCASTAAARTDKTPWDRYQILYVRIVNSGSLVLLLEAALGVQAAYLQLSTLQGGADKGAKREMLKAQLSFLLAVGVLGAYIPAIMSHIIPMVVVFPWVVMFVYVFGIKILMSWPADFVNDYLAADWKNSVPKAPIYYLVIANVLSIWAKFTSNFLLALPIQMFYNFGVLLYGGIPYWEIAEREYYSRSWDCFFEHTPHENAADTMQLTSFFL